MMMMRMRMNTDYGLIMVPPPCGKQLIIYTSDTTVNCGMDAPFGFLLLSKTRLNRCRRFCDDGANN
jgi:hypothetical protein